MRTRTVVIAVLACAMCVLVIVAGLATGANDVTVEELTRRAEACQPTWQNYPEDIKGQMGARPAAEWSGEPISATRDGSTVRITFRLSGAWAQRTAAIPILLREPHGGTFKNQRAECAEGSVTYVFELPEADGASLPWVEIKYPSGEKRMIF